MKFKADEIASVIREQIARYHRELDVSEVGRVLEVGDGIAQLYGLTSAMSGEMLRFSNGQLGQVFNLEESSLGAVIYGSCAKIKAGDEVRATGKLLKVPVGAELLGRVVDPLGNPLDGAGAIQTDQTRPVEVRAAGIVEREPVSEPLETGIRAIDSMLPIGRGQRELIIGDRKTGKTAIAVDTIINQKDSGVICVYVAIGQKESSVASVVDILSAHGAMAHTIIVSASSSDPAPLQYIAPYAGCSIAEYFMYEQGRATLIVYDDLSKQATAYRQISLLLRRPPGREAYPGDVFYLHSRLLERACKLAGRYVIAPADTPEDAEEVERADGKVYVGKLGRAEAEDVRRSLPDADDLKVHRLAGSGGSMTALPICETQEGEVAAYIPTNLISITDGQIYLEPSLFFAGIRPAINVGISVSRVGYKAASKAMKTVAASLRLDLATYRELESFAQLGMDLDHATQRQLDRGQRMVRLLTQRQYSPRPVADQIITIFVGAGGYLDDLPVEEIHAFADGVLTYVKSVHKDFFKEFVEDMTLPDERAKRLDFIIDEYKQGPWVQIRKDANRREKSGE